MPIYWAAVLPNAWRTKATATTPHSAAASPQAAPQTDRLLPAPQTAQTANIKSCAAAGPQALVKQGYHVKSGLLRRRGPHQQADVGYDIIYPKGLKPHAVTAQTPVIAAISGLNLSQQCADPKILAACAHHAVVVCPENRGVGISRYCGPQGSSPEWVTVWNLVRHSVAPGLQRMRAQVHQASQYAPCLTALAASSAACTAAYFAPLSSAAACLTGAVAWWHGPPSEPQPDFRIDDLANDVETLLELLHLHNNPIVLSSVSMGTMISQQILLNAPARLSNIQGATLMFPGFGAMMGSHIPQFSFLWKMYYYGAVGRADDIVRLLLNDTQQEHCEQETRYLRSLPRHQPDTINQNGRRQQASAISARPDKRAQLAAWLQQHKLPLLLIAGRHDRLIPPQNIDAFRRMLGADAHLLRQIDLESGHWITQRGAEHQRAIDALHTYLSERFAPRVMRDPPSR